MTNMNDMWRSMSEMNSSFMKSMTGNMSNNTANTNPMNGTMRKNAEVTAKVAQNYASCLQASAQAIMASQKKNTTDFFNAMKGGQSSGDRQNIVSHMNKCNQSFMENSMNLVRELGEIWGKTAMNNFDHLSKTCWDNMNQAQETVANVTNIARKKATNNS